MGTIEIYNCTLCRDQFPSIMTDMCIGYIVLLNLEFLFTSHILPKVTRYLWCKINKTPLAHFLP